MSELQRLYAAIHRPVPEALDDWAQKVGEWCRQYSAQWASANLSEINLAPAVFIFDHACERVCLAYAVSVPQLMARVSSRIRGFPKVDDSVRKVLGEKAFPADRGHFLGHASGGDLDINLFPQLRQLNRGWSTEGKRFRRMERFAASNSGTFFFHRSLYDDETWIPSRLEYGVLREDGTWWTETFHNRPSIDGGSSADQL